MPLRLFLGEEVTKDGVTFKLDMARDSKLENSGDKLMTVHKNVIVVQM